MESAYNLSKDYEKLYSIICEGKIAVGFVDYDWNYDGKHIVKDVCAIKRQKENYIDIGVRGMSYVSIYPFNFKDCALTEKEFFIKVCENCNLEFVMPIESGE